MAHDEETQRLRDYLKRVSLDLRDARGRLREIEQRDGEPIAIVGMGCRFPGGVGSPEELWELLAAGGEAIGPLPADRGWDLDGFHHPDPDHHGTSYVRHGGFLDAAAFDADFFGISPREATAMDPQQRLLLETSWEALEYAGIDPTSLRGTPTGVFAGCNHHEYGAPLQYAPESVAGHLVTGVVPSVASGRVAYTLGLEGPAVSIDTACSTSLVALHLAVAALRSAECSLALAGGAAVMSTPGTFVEFSRQRALAADGRCKAFGAGADGMGLGEGAAVVVLERLSDARRNGHPVLALVRGSALNQDGASNGLSAPHGPAQQRVIRAALAAAGLGPDEVDAVEAHGTGTRLGDPIEAQALLATYGQGRPADRPLLIGSIKSNLGHAQAAAGAAGVIKMVLALRHGAIPRTLHADPASPEVDWSSGAVRPTVDQTDWPETGRPRRAAVSAFGISGTNAHVILEQAPDSESESEPAVQLQPETHSRPESAVRAAAWILSARSESALRAQAARLHARLAGDVPDLHDVAYTLAAGRTLFDHRAVVVGTEAPELLDSLAALARAGSDSRLRTGTASSTRKPVFVFPGQGSQWVGMGRRLWESSPVFADRVAQCEQALSPHVDWSLTEVLRGEPLDRVDVVQPVLWAMMVSLAALWRHHGVEPSAVVGHSQGEIAAATVVGALSLEDGARVVALRARLLARLAGENGGMMSIQEPAEKVAARLSTHDGRVSIAALNGPASTVVSGDIQDLHAILAECEAEGVRARLIPVDYASHCAQVDAIKDDLLIALSGIEPRPASVPFYSTVTAGLLDTTNLTPDYWYTNLREPVRFETTVRALLAANARAFIEVSPHPVLTVSVEEVSEQSGADAFCTGSLRRDEDADTRFLLSLAEAHVAGLAVRWPNAAPPTARRVPLPTYPFERTRHWLAPAVRTEDARRLGLDPSRHPLVGATLRVAGADRVVLTGRLSTATSPWLADHAVTGTALLPGTGFVDLVLTAGEAVGCDVVDELTLHTPLLTSEAARVQVVVEEAGEQGRRRVLVYSQPDSFGDDADTADSDDPWTLHADGALAIADEPPSGGIAQWPPSGAQPIDVDGCYDRLAALGYHYGPAFRGLRAAWRRDDEVFAEVVAPEAIAGDIGRFAVHPALLDAALHAALLVETPGEEAEGPRLPFIWSGVRLHAVGAATLRVRLAPTGRHAMTVLAVDATGAPVIEAREVSTRPLPPDRLRAMRADLLYRTEWRALEPPLDRTVSAESEPETREVVLVVSPMPGTPPQAAQATVEDVASQIKAWLAGDDGSPDSRLIVVTHHAVAAAPGEIPDLVLAPVWGLVRSAQSEHPGRIVLIDLDDPDALPTVLPRALATGEPQLAVRSRVLFVPRLARAALTPHPDAAPWDPDGTVLITGGVGVLGTLLAEHLVTERGARRLLLVGRQGTDTVGASDLIARLTELGAAVTVAACDVADRAALAALLATVPPEHPLTAVVHAAGVVADSVVESLTGEQLAAVFAPKADAAWNLHELTAELPLAAFVLYSSAAAQLGGPGQGSYAAANTFLDALAVHRRGSGLPAVSLGWGLWERPSGLTGKLGAADVARMARTGVLAMSAADALAQFDRALAAAPVLTTAAESDPVLTVLRLDDAMLRARAAELPPVLRGLVRVPSRRAASASASADHAAGLRERLATMTVRERETAMSALVRAEASVVLGHASADAVPDGRAFKDLGFDSLTSVELRNRLSSATGMRLPASLVFDYPTPTALAAYLLSESGLAAAPSRAIDVRSRTRPGGGADRDAEPIAIVGIGCRFPGGVSSPQELWDFVAAGRDAIGPFPTDRGWDLERLYDPDPDSPGTCHIREGGFLYQAADFDAGFFGIAPREALAMDPQQRLLLETSWEALEHAGIDPASLHGSRTGVFAGVIYDDYGSRVPDPPAELEPYLGNGSAGSVASGRVSYVLGLRGPAVTVDTACSSSLVAIHLASASLRTGECSLTLAGGVTVMTTPRALVEFSRQRGLALDGRCKAFADGADGTSLAEGAGVLVLERLSDARRLGHRVLGLIRGSAVNQDGASNGLTAPNGPAQQEVIRQALDAAGLAADQVDAVEAHGTGTALGDPIEAQALLAAYGRDRPAERPLLFGSVKSNIGHAQAAAGVAGVIKMVAAMRHGILPASLHIGTPSRAIDWSAGAAWPVAGQVPWPQTGRARRAGVSSFGISGTNAHVILEQAPGEIGLEPGLEPEHELESAATRAPLSWLVSARTGQGLREQAARLCSYLEDRPNLRVADVAWTLATGRAAMEHRGAVVGEHREELLAGLRALAQGETSSGLWTGSAAHPGQLAFLFAGQGAQRVGMGRDLYAAYPAFAGKLDEVCEQLDPRLDRPLREVMWAEPDTDEARLLDRTDYAQASLFVLEVSLFHLLGSWGVVPDQLVGHSIGELAAAHVAGVLSSADACALVAARGRLMRELPEGGAMAAVEAPEEVVRARLAENVGDGADIPVAVAAVNGPSATVISGDEDAVLDVAAFFEASGTRIRRLRVSHAFHSARMDPMLEGFQRIAETLDYQPPRIPIVSTLTGSPASAEELCSAEYWTRQVRQTVRFGDAVERLAESGATTCVEIGPDGALAALAGQALTAAAARDVVTLGALRRDRSEAGTLLAAVARMSVRGHEVDWSAVLAGQGGRPVELPTYAFQRQRIWLDADPALGSRALSGPDAADHPLLDSAMDVADSGTRVFTGTLSARTQPWLADHVVLGGVLAPATAFVEMALAAGLRAGCGRLAELTIEAPLPLGAYSSDGSDAAGDAQVQVALGTADERGRRAFRIHARAADASWSRHAVGMMEPATVGDDPAADPVHWPPPGARPLDVSRLYDELAEAGFAYGPAFRGVRAAWRDGDDVCAEVALPEAQHAAAARFELHPALLDACVHAAALGGLAGAAGSGQLLLPFAWSGMTLHARGVAEARVRLTPTGTGTFRVLMTDAAGRPIVGGELALRAAAAGSQASLLRVVWERLVISDAPDARADSWVVLGADEQSLDLLTGLKAGGVQVKAAADFAELLEPTEGIEPDGRIADVVVLPVIETTADPGATDPAASAIIPREPDPHASLRSALLRALAAVQAWSADERCARSRLVLVTRGAIVAGPDDPAPDLTQAAVWGLLRSAQAEHPHRFVVLDLDPRSDIGDGSDSARLIPAAVASGETQFAIRAGVLHTPRLAHLTPRSSQPSANIGSPDGTVLITGGTGTLGALVAHHLVTRHGARRLLLVSRRGPDASGAAQLSQRLTELGADVTVAACDVADRRALEALLATIPASHPLTAVVHAAGVTEDVPVGGLDADRLDRVLAPKADAAWQLHDLTRHLDLDAFVLFSSLAATLGSPGQANYAAANAFLDALAHSRRLAGLPATSLAWGPWESRSTITARLDTAALARMARAGVASLTDEEALSLFDAALAPDVGQAVLAPVRLETAALRARADAAELPALLRGLVPSQSRPETAPAGPQSGLERGTWALRLRAMPVDKGPEAVLGFVRAQVAAVLGFSDVAAVDTTRAYFDMGFDSLTVLELRNRLADGLDMPLPATLVFEYSTPEDLAGYLWTLLAGPELEPEPGPEPDGDDGGPVDDEDFLADATDEDLFALVDELGDL